MRRFNYGPLGIVGIVLVVAGAVADILRLALEWPLLRRLLEMANLGQAIDFALDHWQHPGWLGNPWIQILIIAVGLALIFWDRRRPEWLPSAEVSPSKIILGGLIIIVLGVIVVCTGIWQQS